MMLIQTRRFQLSRRGAFLALFGIVFILLGYSYLNIPPDSVPQLRHYLRFALSLAPIEFYGWAWIACGAIALIGGLWHPLDWLGFAAAVFMPLAWAVAYFDAEFQDGVPRAWVSGMVFALLAGAIGLVAGMADPLDHGAPRHIFRRWRR